MLYNGLQFHNVAELEKREYMGGLRLHRFPRGVRESLSQKGRLKAAHSNNCEIRFVTEASSVRISVGALETNGRVLVFRGDFFHSSHPLQAGVAHTIQLDVPERFAEVPREALTNRAFAPEVWRLFFDRFTAVFYDIDAYGYAVRPPNPDEVPQLAFVAYGSSITQGVGALSHYNCYVQQAARALHVDAINLGLSGSCMCEKEVADHIAERTDWDFAYLELGVNMRGHYTAQQFRERAGYLLDRVLKNSAGKPVFATTIYPNRATYFIDSGHMFAEREKQYNEVLRSYAAECGATNLHLLEGSDIMTEFTTLSSDLIHPSEYGHVQMGVNLSGLLRPVVETLRRKVAAEAPAK